MKLKFVPIRNEDYRVYIFSAGSVRVERVVRLCLRPSGGHRLETSDGRKFIVAPGWLAIEVGAKEWTR